MDCLVTAVESCFVFRLGKQVYYSSRKELALSPDANQAIDPTLAHYTSYCLLIETISTSNPVNHLIYYRLVNFTFLFSYVYHS